MWLHKCSVLNIGQICRLYLIHRSLAYCLFRLLHEACFQDFSDHIITLVNSLSCYILSWQSLDILKVYCLFLNFILILATALYFELWRSLSYLQITRFSLSIEHIILNWHSHHLSDLIELDKFLLSFLASHFFNPLADI